jgi:hypothetical protein
VTYTVWIFCRHSGHHCFSRRSLRHCVTVLWLILGSVDDFGVELLVFDCFFLRTYTLRVSIVNLLLLLAFTKTVVLCWFSHLHCNYTESCELHVCKTVYRLCMIVSSFGRLCTMCVWCYCGDCSPM